MQERRLTAARTKLARTQVSTLRDALLKIGARVHSSVRRIAQSMDSSRAVCEMQSKRHDGRQGRSTLGASISHESLCTYSLRLWYPPERDYRVVHSSSERDTFSIVGSFLMTTTVNTDSTDTSRYKLSDEELRFWDENGYVGPYTAWSPEEMADMRELIYRSCRGPSKTFGFWAARDRHLDCKTLYEACTHPAIIERSASIRGPDLLLWRTTFFRKMPGGARIDWHQGLNFPGFRLLPAIEPAENITCWLALTDATKGNACVQLIPGSHKREYKVRAVEHSEGIFGRGYVMDGLNTSTRVYMELKAGQFFLFTEHTVHGSDPNDSDTERAGIAIRITSNSTKIYKDMKVDGQGMPLKNWHAIQVHGHDTYGHNKIGPPPDRDYYHFGRIKRLRGRLMRRWYRRVYGHEN